PHHLASPSCPLPPSPTRRSSDLGDLFLGAVDLSRDLGVGSAFGQELQEPPFDVVDVRGPIDVGLGSRLRFRLEGEVKPTPRSRLDRKSTRLNSSHVAISYAVFCL